MPKLHKNGHKKLHELNARVCQAALRKLGFPHGAGRGWGTKFLPSPSSHQLGLPVPSSALSSLDYRFPLGRSLARAPYSLLGVPGPGSFCLGSRLPPVLSRAQNSCLLPRPSWPGSRLPPLHSPQVPPSPASTASVGPTSLTFDHWPAVCACVLPRELYLPSVSAAQSLKPQPPCARSTSGLFQP